MNAPRQSAGVWLVMIIAIIASMLFAGLLVRIASVERLTSVSQVAKTTPIKSPPQAGVAARISAGQLTVERTLPSLSFALEPGQSLDARIRPGPFEAEFTVRFHPGDVQLATFGAEIENASIIIKRGDDVILSDYAEAGGKVAMAKLPTSLTRRWQSITYIFKSDGTSVCRLRAMWQPAKSSKPLPLPSPGAKLHDDPVQRGMMLVQQFNCAACHVSSDSQLQALLHVSPAPNLLSAGQRLKPEWIQRWVQSPQETKPGTRMPAMFHGAPHTAQDIDDLTHFLASLGGPIDRSAIMPDPDIISTGMVSYHTVGCVACHGPLEPLESLPGARKSTGYLTQRYEPLGELSRKTNAGQLAAMLRDPLAVYPSGHMPSLNLSDLESDSIASYLIARDLNQRGEARDAEFDLDQERANRGRKVFIEQGCANCHAVEVNGSHIEPLRTAPSLESIAHGKEPRGCIAAEPSSDDRMPHFSMSGVKRSAIVAFLNSMDERKTHEVPLDRAALTLSRLNCTACHTYFAENGPEPAILQYFTTIEEADLGDEGRLPPPLADVGAKLNPGWLREVLEGNGRVRPYMGVRMPQFGEANVQDLTSDLAACGGTNVKPDHGPTSPSDYASIGRELVGSKGFNCIQCHTIAGNDATGTPGPDLATMTERLRFDNFARWLHDPKLVRPGTRMPTFFVDGRSGFTNLLDGEAEKQIQAIWAYLSQGEFLPLPEGLVDQAGLELRVQNEPLVFRTFIKQAGVRAIACGFPEQVHCAFDADKCRLALVWDGPFLNAKGAWAARGGTETNPSRIVWTASDEQTIRIVKSEGDLVDCDLRFGGYRLDHQRRPIFMYQASDGTNTIEVEEQPIPIRENGEAKLVRRFELRGPAGVQIAILDQRIMIASNGQAQFQSEVNW